MSKTVTLRLDEDSYNTLREAAVAERRPLSNMIETAALARIREQQFIDDPEMAEIRANEALLKRIKVGSGQAVRLTGQFVD